MSTRRGMTIVQVVAVLVCLVVLVAIIVPASRMRPRGCGVAIRDSSQLREIHRSFLVWSESNKGRLPVPGLLNRHHDVFTNLELPGSGPENVEKNTTRHLYSMMVALEYFNTDILIGPTEENPRIAEHADYDYSQYQPAHDIYWDGDDATNGTGAPGGMLATLDGTNDEPCHASYAHLALVGASMKKKWRDSGDATQPILCTRMPWRRATTGPDFDDSYTLLLHGGKDAWAGNVTFADNHVELLEHYPTGDDELGMTKKPYTQYREELRR